MLQPEFKMELKWIFFSIEDEFCVCVLSVSGIISWITNCMCVSVYTCTSSHGRPSACSCVSVSACVCLMQCPKQSPHWDIMVRQTYSTTQIKINKQSEVFTLNTASFFKRCFFNEYTTWPGPQWRRQVLSLGEIR